MKKLYSKPEYFEELKSRLAKSKPGDKVFIFSMGFRAELPEIDEIVKSICHATKRGVKVRLSIDAYTFLVGEKTKLGPLFYGKSFENSPKGVFKKRLDALNDIKAAGGEFVILNVPSRRFSNPFAGRSHIKLAIFGDTLFLGGCNLDEDYFDDLMLGIKDKSLAKRIFKITEQIFISDNVKKSLDFKDKMLSSNKDKIYIDAGIASQSLILDRALKAVDSANKRVLIASQFFPQGKMLKRLRQARKRGVEIKILYNNPSQFPNLRLPRHAHLFANKLKNPSDFFIHQIDKKDPFLHAKVLVTEKEVIIGSHNFVGIGVKFGTAEIALHSTEQKFIQQVFKKFNF